jgi:uncharacterized membrane protein
MTRPAKSFQSDISGEQFPIKERVLGSSVRESVLHVIQSEHPGFTANSVLALRELNAYREKYISNFLSRELGEISQLKQAVLDSLSSETTLTDQLDEKDDKLTLGQRLADKVATFGGSWTFILTFGFFLLVWIFTNVYWLANSGFDPYPFILLNLILSCIAALQAPVIMMSQNRQEEKDRERARKDYMINLKSELEIRVLHEKLDHLIIHQQQELMEVQKVQIEMMTDILETVRGKS